MVPPGFTPAGLVLQAHPLRPTRAVILGAHILPDIRLTFDQELPGFLSIGHANSMGSLEHLVFLQCCNIPFLVYFTK